MSPSRSEKVYFGKSHREVWEADRESTVPTAPKGQPSFFQHVVSPAKWLSPGCPCTVEIVSSGTIMKGGWRVSLVTWDD